MKPVPMVTSTKLIEPALRRVFTDELRETLRQRFGSQLSTGVSALNNHARGESPFPPAPPQAVLMARQLEDVVDAMRICRDHKLPVIAHGAGSSLEGQLLALEGGLSVDLTGLDAIVSINPEDLTATVQAGVTREQLNDALKPHGLFFPIDPGAHATLGGMVATRASGTNAVRYGSMRENVLALTAVTADARVVQTGTRARKSAAGYDLTRLFVGSEGTLGLITEVTLRLYPLPEAISAAVVVFAETRGAVNTVIQAMQMGVPLARCEYLCTRSIEAINQVHAMNLRMQPTLFLEFHGTTVSLPEQIELMQTLSGENGGEGFEWAQQPEDRTRLWKARHNAYYACRAVRSGSEVIATDTCVPISQLAGSLEGAAAILQSASFPTMLFGHVGDGNFHALLIIDPSNPAELAEAERLNEAIVMLAIEAGGTCTGEHGIGLHKMDFLRVEAGEEGIELMQRIKSAFDPLNLLNPGKIFALPSIAIH